MAITERLRFKRPSFSFDLKGVLKDRDGSRGLSRKNVAILALALVALVGTSLIGNALGDLLYGVLIVAIVGLIVWQRKRILPLVWPTVKYIALFKWLLIWFEISGRERLRTIAILPYRRDLRRATNQKIRPSGDMRLDIPDALQVLISLYLLWMCGVMPIVNRWSWVSFELNLVYIMLVNVLVLLSYFDKDKTRIETPVLVIAAFLSMVWFAFTLQMVSGDRYIGSMLGHTGIEFALIAVFVLVLELILQPLIYRRQRLKSEPSNTRQTQVTKAINVAPRASILSHDDEEDLDEDEEDEFPEEDDEDQ